MIRQGLKEDGFNVSISKLFIARDTVKNMNAHPTQYHLFHRVWLDA